MKRLIFAISVLFSCFGAIPVAKADCPIPWLEHACRCHRLPSPGPGTPGGRVCSVKRPPCLPCLNGCTPGGTCNVAPIVDGDGWPLATNRYKSCTRDSSGGQCDDNEYQWVCDNTSLAPRWCVDSEENYWRFENNR